VRNTNYKLNHYAIINFSAHFFLNLKCCTQHPFHHHPQSTFHCWGRNLVPYPYETTDKIVNFRLLNLCASNRVQIIQNVLTTGLHLVPLPSTWCLCPPPGAFALHLAPLPSTLRLCPPPGAFALHLAPLPSTWCLCPPPGAFSLHLVPLPSTWCLCSPHPVSLLGQDFSPSTLLPIGPG
jgi:hypothetical protein